MSTELATRPQTPMGMIQRAFDAALESGQGLEVADRIIAHMKEQRDYEDRENFNSALRRIQDKLKPIGKDGWNPQTNSSFASARSVDNMIEGLIREERMTLSFEPEPHEMPQMIRIVGVLSMGAYSKRYPLDMPADGQGPKGGGVMSRTHATGAAITYAKRYLKNMIFNLRFMEKDDDGNGAADSSSRMDEIVLLEWIDALNQAPNMGVLKSIFKDAYTAAKESGDAIALKQIVDTYESAKKAVV